MWDLRFASTELRIFILGLNVPSLAFLDGSRRYTFFTLPEGREKDFLFFLWIVFADVYFSGVAFIA